MKQRNNRYTCGYVIDEASPLFPSILMTTNPFSTNWWRVQHCNGQREQFGLLCRGIKPNCPQARQTRPRKKFLGRELLSFCTWKKRVPYKVNHQFIVVDIKQKLALLCSSLGKALNLQKVLQLDVILFGLGNFGALL